MADTHEPGPLSPEPMTIDAAISPTLPAVARRWSPLLSAVTMSMVIALAVVAAMAGPTRWVALLGTVIAAGLLHRALARGAGEPAANVAALASLYVGACDPTPASVMALLACACMAVGIARDRAWWIIVGGAIAATGAAQHASAGVLPFALIVALIATRAQRSWPRLRRMTLAAIVSAMAAMITAIVLPRAFDSGPLWPLIVALLPLGVRLIAGLDHRKDGTMTLMEGSRQITVDPFGASRKTLVWFASVSLGLTLLLTACNVAPSPGLLASAPLLLGLSFRRRRPVLEAITLLPSAAAAMILAWLG